RFMGKDWERIQTEKLVLEQEVKIAKLKKEMEDDYALRAEKAQELYNFEKEKRKSDLDNATEEW
ncbi:MAG: hypothetical protein Q7U21_12420, partial [Lutibacter sp.]|nr:hypothetical protein [Lutibacter sp.]